MSRYECRTAKVGMGQRSGLAAPSCADGAGPGVDQRLTTNGNRAARSVSCRGGVRTRSWSGKQLIRSGGNRGNAVLRNMASKGCIHVRHGPAPPRVQAALQNSRTTGKRRTTPCHAAKVRCEPPCYAAQLRPTLGWASIMIGIRTRFIFVAVALSLAACSEKSLPESEVYTLYSTNFPNDYGRSGVATFDLANIPELSSQICQESADLFQKDFEERKKKNGWSADTKMRYWCEKGRFKK